MEQAHLHGMLDAASLMVAGPAVADAVARARRLPKLRVGLHLVVVEGRATLPPGEIPDLVDGTGWFGSDQVRRGLQYFFSLRARRQLSAEIAAQFAAYAATGLALGHADAHKHMHLHPTVGRLLIEHGRRHGLTRVRVPAEPPAVMQACGTEATTGSRALYRWTGVLRRQVRHAGLQADDHVFGIAWSGHMTAARLTALARQLPPGSCEIYTHPATIRDPLLARLMPDYDHAGELAALCDPVVAESFAEGRVP